MKPSTPEPASPASSMHLRVLVPFKVFADRVGVTRVVAETPGGSFGLLPHRLDCVAALTLGILIYEAEPEGEVYLAVDEGVLVKTGTDVTVSVRRAIAGTDLRTLRDRVEDEFARLNEQERSVRVVMTRLETGVLKRLHGLAI